MKGPSLQLIKNNWGGALFSGQMTRKTGSYGETAGQSQGAFVFAQHHSICTPSLAVPQLVFLPSAHPFDAGIRRRREARSLGRNDTELSVGCHGPVRLPLLTALLAVPKTARVSFPSVRDKAGGLRDGATRWHADDCELPVIPAE